MSDPQRRSGEPAGAVSSIVDAVADLLQSAADWVRQEAGDIVRDRIVLPLQRLGLTLASASAAGCLAALGLAFIAVAAFLFLAQWLTYPGALLAVGGVLVLASAVFTVIKVRWLQR
jgi:hypothetical protein